MCISESLLYSISWPDIANQLYFNNRHLKTEGNSDRSATMVCSREGAPHDQRSGAAVSGDGLGVFKQPGWQLHLAVSLAACSHAAGPQTRGREGSGLSLGHSRVGRDLGLSCSV